MSEKKVAVDNSTKSTAKLAELKDKAESLCQKYNELTGEKKYEERDKVDEELEKVVNEYTSIVREMCFENCRNTENPMLTAVTTLNFVTIATKDVPVEGSKSLKKREIVNKERPIDLRKLDKHCKGIGASDKWYGAVQKLNFALTADMAKKLGIDPKDINDSYAMSDIAKQYDMGKDPASKTNLLKSLNLVIAAMLGDGYKAVSHDVNYLLAIYAKKNRAALTVSCANHSNFTNYIAEICHRIVTGKSYEVMYKKVKS